MHIYMYTYIHLYIIYNKTIQSAVWCSNTKAVYIIYIQDSISKKSLRWKLNSAWTASHGWPQADHPPGARHINTTLHSLPNFSRSANSPLV